MDWLNKLEKRFGFIAIPHILTYVIVGQAMATFLGMQQNGIVEQMILDPVAVAHGEYWRLLTFIMVPSLTPLSLIFAIFWFYFLWFMGQGLEQEWGSFKLTVYLISGLVFQILVSMLAYLLFHIAIVQEGYYWTLSIQLAFAYLYPEFTIYMFMILPIKMRWWAWFIGAMLIFQAVTGGTAALIVIAASLGNYLIFFGPEYLLNFRLRRQNSAVRGQMKKSLASAMATAPQKRCERCGKDAYAVDIRLCTCSICGEDGKFWCTDHLPAHVGK